LAAEKKHVNEQPDLDTPKTCNNAAWRRLSSALLVKVGSVWELVRQTHNFGGYSATRKTWWRVWSTSVTRAWGRREHEL
jgi:hypothetical protein